MRRATAWALLGLGVLLLAGVVAVAAIPRLVDTARVRALIAGAAAQSLGRPVSFASIHVSVLPLPAVMLRDVEVAEDPAFGQGAFVRLPEARIRLRLWPLLLLRVELGDFVLEKPAIALVQGADGRWNFATLATTSANARRPARTRGSGGGATTSAVLASHILVRGGVVTLDRQTGEGARYRVEDLDLRASQEPAGPIVFRATAMLRPGDVAIEVVDGSLGLTAARGMLDAPLAGKVGVRGSKVRDLVAATLGSTPEVDGSLKGVFTLGGSVGRPRATGDLELTGLAVSQVNPRCPEPRRRTLQFGAAKASTALEDRRVTMRPVVTSLGAGEIKANLAVTLGAGRAELTDVTITRMPVERVLVDFLCQSYAVTGPLDLRGAVDALPSDPWHTASGTGNVKVGPGRIVGAEALALIDGVLRVGGTISSVLRGDVPTAGPAPLDYESITATYRITNGVLTTRDLQLTSRVLQISATGTYALASGVLDFDTRVRHAGGELRAKVTGPAASPSIRLTDTAGLRDVDPARVRKGLEDLLQRFR